MEIKEKSGIEKRRPQDNTLGQNVYYVRGHHYT